MLGLGLRHRMADRGEIVDQDVAIDAKLFVHQRGADDPRVVGEFDQLALHRPGDGDCGGGW